jgi:hypothetical protein
MPSGDGGSGGCGVRGIFAGDGGRRRLRLPARARAESPSRAAPARPGPA